jgi:type I restriction enzyme S subunit
MYKKIPLKEIAEINPSRPKFTLKHETEVSFIPMSDVTDNGRWSRRQVRQYQEVCSGYTCFLNGDVLFAKITPCMENGKGCLVTELKNGIGFGSTEFHVLRARTKGDPGFIYQWSTYRLFRLQAAASMTGSAGQQRVPASFLETFNMPAIDKPEQSKIAEILSTVDRVIEQTEALIAKQQRIKTGLMQDLLTRGIDEHGNIRSEETHQFKDSRWRHKTSE